MILAAKNEYKRRFKICEECEFSRVAFNIKKVKGLGCKKCGCFMNVKAKLYRMKCPVGKW
jgi:hypothetical protein